MSRSYLLMGKKHRECTNTIFFVSLFEMLRKEIPF